MDSERQSKQDAADKYSSAVAAAGQAVIAVRSGMGIATVGIERAEIGEETRYRAVCIPRRFRGAASTLRFIVAQEAAEVALGLSSFGEVNCLAEHRAASQVIRGWDGYWGAYPSFLKLNDNWAVDEEEEETKHLIWLARWQVRRRFRYEPERKGIENLALLIRDRESLSGTEAERFVRCSCRLKG